MPTRVVTLTVSFAAGLAWVGLLSVLLPAGAESGLGEFLLDRDRGSYPFTIQNLMWVVFFVAAGDLLVSRLPLPGRAFGTRPAPQPRRLPR